MSSRVFAALALALVLATPVQAAGVSTSGSIIRINESSDSFLFSNPQHTYYASGARMTLDGAAADLSQIQPGDTATLTLNDTSAGLARIDAHSQPVQQFSGPFASYSAKYRNIGASLGGGATRIFWLDPSTQVTLNGAPASVGNLQSGDALAISYRTTTALSIAASR